MCVHLYAFTSLNLILQVTPFLNKHGLRPCMVAPTKIIAGLGLSLGIDILDAPGATGDYRTLLTSKASAIAKALSAPLQSCPKVFVPGEDEFKAGRSDGYDFGFLHIKVINLLLFVFLICFYFSAIFLLSVQESLFTDGEFCTIFLLQCRKKLSSIYCN